MELDLKTALADLLFPPLCIACREPLGQGRGFCASCWSRIVFLDGPMCECCGLPFGVDPGPGARCAACLAKPPSYARARAILAYDDLSCRSNTPTGWNWSRALRFGWSGPANV